jgi:hypothetical protein
MTKLILVAATVAFSLFAINSASALTPEPDLPYCDEVESGLVESTGSCWDRKDYSDDTGLYSCRDGTEEKDWKDCK